MDRYTLQPPRMSHRLSSLTHAPPPPPLSFHLAVRWCPGLWSSLHVGRSAPLRIWGKFKGVWFYIFTTSVENLEGAAIPDAVAVSSVVTSDKFSPEMCFTLAELLLQQYAQGGSGTSLLASYLSVYT